MGNIKDNLRAPFRWRKVYIEHENVADFHLSCWQKNRSSLPLLLFRAFLFLFSLSIVIYSLVASSSSSTVLDYWVIYLTHWGLLMVVVSTGAATAVSALSFFKGPIDGSLGLPWHVKVFWVLYNIGITLAFMITVFYWSFLSNTDAYDADIEFAINRALDILIHGINSVIMFLLLMTSRHPSRFLHVYQPLLFAIVYMFFSLIYYFAGGVDMFGNNFIYPMLAWDSPGPTVIMVLLTAVLIIVVHAVVVAFATGRDALARKLGILKEASFDMPLYC